MGLKASNTCEMTFGDRHPAKLADRRQARRHPPDVPHHRVRPHDGRHEAISTLSTGYLNALEYAKERVQGPDLANFMDKTAPKVTITHHPTCAAR